MFSYISLSDGSCSVLGTTSTALNLTIPAQVVYGGTTYPVSQIGFNAFKNQNFTSVIIPSSVENILDNAFEGCSKLKEITIPKSVKYIGFGVFANCTSLLSVNIEDSNDILEYGFDTTYPYTGIFEGCSITSAYIGREVLYYPNESTGRSLFYGQESLRNVQIADHVSLLGPYYFCGCSSLKDITLPQNLQHLETYTFSSCHLESLTVNPNLKSMSYASLGAVDNIYVPNLELWLNINLAKDCRPLLGNTKTKLYFNGNLVTSITIPDGVKEISRNTFCGYSYLESVVLPASVKKIGDDAFMKCENLTSINLENVETISKRAFYQDINLNSVALNSAKQIEEKAFYGDYYIDANLNLPNIEQIGRESFANCVRIKGVNITSPTLKLTARSFDNCYGIKSLVISSNMEEIPDSCFIKCHQISDLKLPSSIKRIGVRSFYDCYSLPSYSTTEELSEIGEYAFSRCDELRSVSLNGNNLEIKQGAFSYCSRLKRVYINSNVRTIGTEAFYQCFVIEGIEFAEGVVSIGDRAFADAHSQELYSFSRFVFPNSLQTIGDKAFGSYVEEIVFGTGLLSIGENSFNVSELKRVSFNSNVDSKTKFGASERILGENVFSITSNMLSGSPFIDVYEVPSRISSIESRSFSGCVNFKKLIIPKAQQSIGLYGDILSGAPVDTVVIERDYYVFNDSPFKASGIKYFNAVNSDCETLSSHCFEDCDELSYVAISKKTSEIGDNAFKNCKSLLSISLPPTITKYGSAIFEGCAVDSIFLFSDTSITGSALSDMANKPKLIVNDPNQYYKANTYPAQFIDENLKYSIYSISPVRRVELYPDNINVGINESLLLHSKYNCIVNEYLTWLSNNTNIASVNECGLITGNKTGKCEIRAGLKTISTVVGVLPDSISLSETILKGFVGETVKLNAVIYPDNATDKSIEWYSRNSKIATVSESGEITFVGSGTTSIYAKALGGISADCEVSVLAVPKSVCITSNYDVFSEGSFVKVIISCEPSNVDIKSVLNKVYIDDEEIGKSKYLMTLYDGNSGVLTILEKLAVGEHTIKISTINDISATFGFIVLPLATGLELSKSGEISTTTDTPFVISARVIPENAFNKEVHWTYDSEKCTITTLPVENGYDSTIEVNPLVLDEPIWISAMCNENLIISDPVCVIFREPVIIQVYADNKNIQYGDDVPDLTYTYIGGNLEGEPVLSCDIDCSSPIGEYVINIDRGSITNENIVLVPGTLTILPATLSITANNCETVYGESDYHLSYAISGFRNNETEHALTKQPVISTTANKYSDVGEYDITVSGAEAQNYNFSYQSGILTIQPADQEITWEQEFDNIEVNDTKILEATCSSGLPVIFSSLDETIASIVIEDNITYAKFLKMGTATITAKAPSSKNFNGASLSKNFIVNVDSGIDDINCSAIKIIIENNHISIYNVAPGQIIGIYSSSGILLYRGYETEFNIEPGYYILCIGEERYKISI